MLSLVLSSLLKPALTCGAALGLLVSPTVTQALALGLAPSQLAPSRPVLHRLAQFRLPAAPRRGTPKGNQRPGTRRLPGDVCPETDVPLTAVNGNNGQDFTRSPHPQFVFYVPYGAEQIRSLEFLLLDGRERRTIFQAAVVPRSQPGWVTVALPPAPDLALESGALYRWYFKLDCNSNEAESPHLVVDGWVARLAEDAAGSAGPGSATPGTAVYDEVSDRAQAYLNEPQNVQAARAWWELLRSLSLSDLIGQPLSQQPLD